MPSSGALCGGMLLVLGALGTLKQRIGLDDVVQTVKEFGTASVELVEWEFGLPERTLEQPWREAIARGLIGPVGRCPATGEDLCAALAA